MSKAKHKKVLSTSQRAELHRIARSAGDRMAIIFQDCDISEAHAMIDVLLAKTFKHRHRTP